MPDISVICIHFQICCVVKFMKHTHTIYYRFPNIGTVLTEDKSDQYTKSSNWAELYKDLVSRNKCSTSKRLMDVMMNQDVVRGNNVNCTDANHLVEIEKVYKLVLCHTVVSSC